MKVQVSQLLVNCHVVDYYVEGYGKVISAHYHRSYGEWLRGWLRSERGVVVGFDSGRTVTWASSVELVASGRISYI
jgi:hypothetical protein